MTKKTLNRDTLQQYFETRHAAPVQILELQPIGGEERGQEAIKQFGYGRPLLVTYKVGAEEKQEVVHRVRQNEFGRERADDRAAAVWLDYRTFNRLPRHVEAVDMLVQDTAGELKSLQTAVELLLVTTYRPGQLYADDLQRIRDEAAVRPQDEERVWQLAAYLAEIHQTRQESPMLWRRRLRDLIGHGEGIMGLTDSYPSNLPYAPSATLQAIEEAANRWRWRLRPMTHRLRQVHGDFHPYNIIFANKTTFYVLDRSRGAWGEPADDVSSISLNYLFFSLQRSGALTEPFRLLHELFWEKYLALRPDEEMLRVIQPWFAWRALVLASPIWYPTLSEDTRRKLLAFARNVLATDAYDYLHVNQYFEENNDSP
jgi:thiamine kinase-like enzyme